MCRRRHQSLSPTNLYANPTHEPKPQSERKKLKMLTRNRQRCRWMRWVCARVSPEQWCLWNYQHEIQKIVIFIECLLIHGRIAVHGTTLYACIRFALVTNDVFLFDVCIRLHKKLQESEWGHTTVDAFFSYSFPLVRCAECWMLAAIQPRRLMLFVGGN